MTLNRFNRNGRDFLQENKQKVAQWETNGRLTAAAAAKRVNLWRPVVLHYAEKLRPHGQRHCRGKNVAPHESPKMHSGLAQPYGFQQEDRIMRPVQRGLRHAKPHRGLADEKVRQSGGYLNQIAKPPKRQQQQEPQQVAQTQTQTEEIKDMQFLKNALHKCEQQPRNLKQTEQSDQAEQPTQQQQQLQQLQIKASDDGDDAVSVFSIKSTASRRSTISRISKKSQHLAEGDKEPETPLSARSNASLKTIRSTATVKSSCSVKSHATVRSEESVKSHATVKSHMSSKSNLTLKSHISDKSKASVRSDKSKAASVRSEKSEASKASHRMETDRQKGGEMHANASETYQQVQNERQAALNDAHYKYSQLIDEYNHLPVSEPTLRVRNRKIAIERELDHLDYAINMYDHNHMYYKR